MWFVNYRPLTILFLTLILLLINTPSFAHCDGMDGPVVKAAQKALQTGDINLVLIWVRKSDEVELRKAFQQTLAVRKLNSDAANLADKYLFDTLVRLHRAGEGAPYTGLKPAGRDLGPAIPMADKALETGSIEPVIQLITSIIQNGIQDHFKEVMQHKNFSKENLESGRKYIEAYVSYVHYIEQLYEVAKNPAHGHYPEDKKEHQE